MMPEQVPPTLPAARNLSAQVGLRSRRGAHTLNGSVMTDPSSHRVRRHRTDAGTPRSCGSFGAVSMFFVTTLSLLVASACGTERVRLADSDFPPPRLTSRGTEVGKCSWYGPGFHGNRTAAGERFDQNAMTAAHRTLPLGTRIRVTDQRTGRAVEVRVNDRGPYHRERMCDLSRAAAQRLGIIGRGVVDAEIRVVSPLYNSYPVVRYSVQLGVFHDRRQAERLASRATSRGSRAFVEAVDRSPTLYCVRLGPYQRRSEAVTAARQLRQQGFRASIKEVVPAPVSPSGNAVHSSTLVRPDARGANPVHVRLAGDVAREHDELGHLVWMQRDQAGAQ